MQLIEHRALSGPGWRVKNKTYKAICTPAVIRSTKWNCVGGIPRRCRQQGAVAAANRFVPQHCDAGDEAGQPKRPNYLLRLKAFALGE